MTTELTRDPGKGPEKSFSQLLIVKGEKMTGGTDAASTGRLKAVSKIHR
jgi:hypothetical protein